MVFGLLSGAVVVAVGVHVFRRMQSKKKTEHQAATPVVVVEDAEQPSAVVEASVVEDADPGTALAVPKTTNQQVAQSEEPARERSRGRDGAPGAAASLSRGGGGGRGGRGGRAPRPVLKRRATQRSKREQAPPIHPTISPSGVTTAWLPTFPDVGPLAQITVTRA